MKKFKLIAVLILFSLSTAIAQEPLQVFGFVQPYFNNYSSRYGDPGPPEGEEDVNYNTMGISQMNLFFAKDFGDDFSAFVNFELINNFSSDRGFGAFNLQEAYLFWDAADYAKIKFGMVIPRFNQLYEIYNRTPLLPFVFRPKLYETNQGNLVDIFDYLPQKSLLHINGLLPVGPFKIDYAAYINYPTNGFFSSESNDLIPGYVAYGQSAVDYLGFGGRLGIKHDYFSIGASAGIDKENRRAYLPSVVKKYSAYLDEETILAYSTDETNLGDLDRFRLGLDFTFQYKNLIISAEYLNLTSDLSDANKQILADWNSADPYFVGKDFDKNFYYAMLQYNINEKFYAYAMYDYLNDNSDPFFFGEDGYGGYSIGGGFNINSSVVLKAQFNQNTAAFDVQEMDKNNDGTVDKGEDVRDFFDTWITVGASISF